MLAARGWDQLVNYAIAAVECAARAMGAGLAVGRHPCCGFSCQQHWAAAAAGRMAQCWATSSLERLSQDSVGQSMLGLNAQCSGTSTDLSSTDRPWWSVLIECHKRKCEIAHRVTFERK